MGFVRPETVQLMDNVESKGVRGNRETKVDKIRVTELWVTRNPGRTCNLVRRSKNLSWNKGMFDDLPMWQTSSVSAPNHLSTSHQAGYLT